MQRVVATLYSLSFLAALLVSLGSRPYTRLAPKKIFLQHLHEHDASGAVHRSVFAIGAVDSVPIDGLLKDVMPGVSYEAKSGWEWQVNQKQRNTFSSLMWASEAHLENRHCGGQSISVLEAQITVIATCCETLPQFIPTHLGREVCCVLLPTPSKKRKFNCNYRQAPGVAQD